MKKIIRIVHFLISELRFLKRIHASVNSVSGFTLVELMISLTIFTTVIISGVTAMITAEASARNAEASRSVMDNLNFAIENLSRNSRLGYDYTCLNNKDIPIDINSESDFPSTKFGQDCSSGTGLVFKVLNTVTGIVDIYGYQLAQTVNPKTNTTYNYIERCKSTDYTANSSFVWVCAPITSSNIDVYNLFFIVKGVTTEGQPGVNLFIDGVSIVKNQNSAFRVQTFLSQRQFKY